MIARERGGIAFFLMQFTATIEDEILDEIGPFRKTTQVKPFVDERVEALHRRLNSHEFELAITPQVSARRVNSALRYLDTHFRGWEKEGFMSAWEYVLPALHHLYPETRRRGYQAQFHPNAQPMGRFAFAMWIGLSLVTALIGAGAAVHAGLLVVNRF